MFHGVNFDEKLQFYFKDVKFLNVSFWIDFTSKLDEKFKNLGNQQLLLT